MLKEKRNILSENKFVILSFIAAAFTMLVIYMCNGMIPLGEHTILRMDLYHQYGPLFAELYERILGGDSLIYSWTSGLGSCFLGNYFNYLSSPIGAIVVFFGHKNVTEAIATMILLKAALSAGTFTWYIKKSLHSSSCASAAFGVLYAFCGYMLAYYWNVMWLDAMILLPVVLLGIERIIDNGKMGTFVVGLSLSMFSNYYMSYMLCMFSVSYFFYYYFKSYSLTSFVTGEYIKGAAFRNNRFLRSGIIFTFGALASAGLMACVLLPVYSILQSCSATSGTFPNDPKSYFTFFDFFANHLANLTTTIRSSGDDVLPNVYCGVLPLILAPLFFFTKSISKKEKFATIALLTVLYFSFNINIFNYVWHGMHFPNDLPYRQSFIYSFVLLIMAYKTFMRLNEFKARHFGVVGAALVIFVVLVEEHTSKNVTAGSVIFSLVLIVLYVLVLAIFKDKRFQAASVAALLVICVCSEAIMCDTSTVHISVTKDPYVSDYDDFSTVKDTLDTIEDGDFYRMELTDLRTRMDPSWYYYNGASVFSSMAYERLSNLQDDMGMMSNRINSYTYNPQTPVYNMMFSMKYIVNNYTPDALANSPNYSPVTSHSKFTAYKNNYVLPIAYCVDSNVASWATDNYLEQWRANTSGDPFALQGDYFNLATGGLGSPFIRLDPDSFTYSNVEAFTEDMSSYSFYYDKITDDLDGSVTAYLSPKIDSNIYIYFEITGAESKSITVNSPIGTMTHTADQNCILDLGYYNVGDTISVNIPVEANTGTIKFYAYALDKEIMDEGYAVLSESQMLTEKFDDTYIRGRFTAENDCLLYTSIPYDKGWNVYIDGEKVPEEKIVMVGKALLGIMVDSGNHTVEFRYKIPAMKEGILITIITVLIIVAYYLIRRLKLRSKKEKAYEIKYNCIDNSFSSDVFLPDTNRDEIAEYSDRASPDNAYYDYDDYPVREVFSPETSVKREVFSPRADIQVTDVDTDQLPIEAPETKDNE